MIQPYIIGITGGSASGKSTFAGALKELFPGETTVLCEDNYYLPKEKVPADSNGVQNYDIPEAFDHLTYITHVRNLRAGKPIEKEEYTFHKPGVIPAILTLHPTPIIVLEGIFALHYEEMRKLTDLKIYMDADPTTRFNRRIARDLNERGLDRNDVEYRWNNHITPRYERDCNEYKAYADIIIQNNTSFQQALNILGSFLKDVAARQ
jgi:uridine kinase